MLQIFLILWRIERDIIIDIEHRSSCKVHVVLVRLHWNLRFLDRFSKNTEISNFMKILLVGEELFNVDGRTDILKAIVAFRNFKKAPKNSRNLFSCQGNMDCWRRTVLHELRSFFNFSISSYKSIWIIKPNKTLCSGVNSLEAFEASFLIILIFN